MARSERQKLKLLYLVRLLEAESDQSHPVTVSPRFFGWLAGFGSSVCILAPAAVRQQMCDHLAAIAACYAPDDDAASKKSGGTAPKNAV